MTAVSNPAVTLAEQAASAARLLTHGAKPGVTPMAIDDLDAATAALAQPAMVLPQLFSQIAGYGCQPSAAVGQLRAASRAATQLYLALDAAHEALAGQAAAVSAVRTINGCARCTLHYGSTDDFRTLSTGWMVDREAVDRCGIGS